MSETAAESEALAILRRIEPALGRLQQDVAATLVDVAAIKATLPHLATKEEVARVVGVLPQLATKDELRQLGYDLTWRFLSLLGVILLAYLAAVWFVVTLTMRAHGVQ
jgi:hypothetical protein